MHQDINCKAMTAEQLEILSFQTCEWWNAVFVQAERFFDASQKNHEIAPWDCEADIEQFIPERMLLIITIDHAIKGLKKLDEELESIGDKSLHNVLDAIDAVAPLKDLKNLRDMNEHGLDYLFNKGRHQDKYQRTVSKGNLSISTTAAMTIIIGDINLFTLGNINIVNLLKVMKEQLPLVRMKMKEIFERAPLIIKQSC